MSLVSDKCESCNTLGSHYECDQCGARIENMTLPITVIFGQHSRFVGQRRDYCTDDCFGQSLKDMVTRLNKGK